MTTVTAAGAGTVDITALHTTAAADLSGLGTHATSTWANHKSLITQNDTVVLNYNGAGDVTITIGALAGTSDSQKLAGINAALDAEYGEGAPVASFSGNSLVITAGAANYTLVGGNFVNNEDNATVDGTDAAGTTVNAALTTANGAAVNFTGEFGQALVTTSGDGILNVDSATDMGTARFSVATGTTLQGTAAKLTTVTAAGAGTVAVTALEDTLGADLSGFGTAPTATFGGVRTGLSAGDTLVVVYNAAGGATVTKTVTLGTLAVGAIDSAKLTAVNAALESAFGKTAPVATFSSNDLVLTGGAANYVLTGGAYTNVDNANAIANVADATDVVGTTVTAALDTSGAKVFSGDFGQALVTTSGNSTLTVTGATMGTARFSVATGTKLMGNSAKLDGVVAAGAGTVDVNETTILVSSDVSGITSTLTFGNTASNTVTINNGVTLTVNENQVSPSAHAASTATATFDGAGHVRIEGFTGDLDLDKVDVTGTVTGVIRSADILGSINIDGSDVNITGEDISGDTLTDFDEVDALVLASGSLKMTAAQANQYAGVFTNDGAGYVVAVGGGDLSALNLSILDELTLNAPTTLPTPTSNLPKRIDAASQNITVGSTTDITGMVIINNADLTVDTNILTLTAAQLSAFDDGDTVAKTNGGQLTVEVGDTADISSLALTQATQIQLDVAGDDVTMTIAQNSLVTSGNGTESAAGDGNDNQITLTNAGTVLGSAGIERYVLSDSGDNTFTAHADTTHVNGGTQGDTISGGTTATVIDGGAGIDSLTGGDGNDIFVFDPSDTGQTVVNFDIISDFATGADALQFDVSAGTLNYLELDGVAEGMLGTNFVANAGTAFASGAGTNVYFVAQIGGTADGYLAVDMDNSNTVSAADVFLTLSGLNGLATLDAADITFI